MSALNAFTYPDKALILTDGAVYDAQNRLLRIERKCLIVEGTDIAVASRGFAWFGPGVAKAMSGFVETIDDIEADGREMIEACIAAARKTFDLSGFRQPVNLALAGWSQRDARPKLFVYNDGAGDLRHVFSEQERIFAPQPLPDHEAARLAALYRTLPARFEAVSHGIPLLEAQRRMVTTKGDGCPIGDSCVGGHILATEITARGVSQTVIHEWPDEIGSKMRPAPALDPVSHANVTPIAGMNRAERRRLEKLQRRGAA